MKWKHLTLTCGHGKNKCVCEKMCVWSPTWIFKIHFLLFYCLYLWLFYPPHITEWQHPLKMEISYYQRALCIVHPMCCLSAVGGRRGGADWEFIYCFFISLKCGDTHGTHRPPFFACQSPAQPCTKSLHQPRLSRCQSSSSAKINNRRQKETKKANKK